MNNLALNYTNQGRWKEAEKLGIQVLETRKKALGLEDPETLLSMNVLASTYWMQRWNKAEELNLQVIETQKRVLETDYPATLATLNNLAVPYER
jgi:hypothetical protein